MARTGRELAVAQSPQFARQRLLGDREAELLPKPGDQIHQTPAHHPVHRWDRASFNHLDQVLAMMIAETGGLARWLAVDQPLRPLSIELEHPVTHDLQGDAADPGCVRSGAAVVDLGKRQKATGLGGVPALFGEPAQSRTVEIPAQGNRRSHGNLPRFATASQTSASPATPRVSLRARWY